MEETNLLAATEEVSREFKTLIDAQDLDSLKQLQHIILGRLQDSNAVLSHFNEFSEHCFAEFSGGFSRNTRILRSMKADLDYIFQKLREIKLRIMAIYPDAFADDSSQEIFDQRPDLEYSEACIKLSQELGVKVVDLFATLQKRDDWATTCFISDGAHFSAEGSNIVVEELATVLQLVVSAGRRV